MLEFKQIIENEWNIFNGEKNERPRKIQYSGDEILYHYTIASRMDSICIHFEKLTCQKKEKKQTRIINCIWM